MLAPAFPGCSFLWTEDTRRRFLIENSFLSGCFHSCGLRSRVRVELPVSPLDWVSLGMRPWSLKWSLPCPSHFVLLEQLPPWPRSGWQAVLGKEGRPAVEARGWVVFSHFLRCPVSVDVSEAEPGRREARLGRSRLVFSCSLR